MWWVREKGALSNREEGWMKAYVCQRRKTSSGIDVEDSDETWIGR